MLETMIVEGRDLLATVAPDAADRCRHRRARPGRAFHRAPDEPADHAGLGPLRRSRVGPTHLRRARPRRQRRQHHRARRARDQLARRRPPHVRQGVDRHRFGHHLGRSPAARRAGLAGDIGHVQVPYSHDSPRSPEDERDLEAVASGTAIALALHSRGHRRHHQRRRRQARAQRRRRPRSRPRVRRAARSARCSRPS